MTMVPHAHHNPSGDPTLPCSSCRKRHVRANDEELQQEQRERSSVGGSKISVGHHRRGRNPISKVAAILAIFAFASASSASSGHIVAHAVPASAVTAVTANHGVAASAGSRGEGDSGKTSKMWSLTSSLWGGDPPYGRFSGRSLQEAEEEELHDHDHGEGEDTHGEDEDDRLHEDHDEDHDVEGTFDDHDDHLHDHDEMVHDDHDDHLEHDDHDEMVHDDHDDHLEHDDHDEMVHDDHDDHLEHDDHDEMVLDDHDDHSVHDDHDDHSEYDHDEFASEFNTFNSENPSSNDEKQPWGQVIGATLIVNLGSLTGLLLVVLPAMHRGYLNYRGVTAAPGALERGESNQGKFVSICIPAFAVGALMATAVFLVFPEGLHLIEGGHGIGEDSHADAVEGGEDNHDGHGHRRFLQDEHAGHDDHAGEGNSESLAAARFGMAILGGFLLPVFLSILFHHGDAPTNAEDSIKSDTGSARDDEECASCKGEVAIGVTVNSDLNAINQDAGIIRKVEEEDSPQANSEEQSEEPLVTKTFIDRRLCASILIGDAFHNFADGLFIGAAFLSCSFGTAMSIVVVTLFHEMAQELADFILLTQYAGLSVWKACVLNFTSGLSVTIGGIVVLAGKPSDVAVGVILAMAGGVYVNIAACETIPRIEGFMKSRGDRVLTLVSFVVGTIPIGLVLLKHEHCG